MSAEITNKDFEVLLKELTNTVERCRGKVDRVNLEHVKKRTAKIRDDLRVAEEKFAACNRKILSLQQEFLSSPDEWERICAELHRVKMEKGMYGDEIVYKCQQIGKENAPGPLTEDEKYMVLSDVLSRINVLFEKNNDEYIHGRLTEFLAKGADEIEKINEELDELQRLKDAIYRVRDEVERLKNTNSSYWSVKHKGNELVALNARVSKVPEEDLRRRKADIEKMIEMINTRQYSKNTKIQTKTPLVIDFVTACGSLYYNPSAMFQSRYGFDEYQYKRMIETILGKCNLRVNFKDGYVGRGHVRVYEDEEMSGSGFGYYKVTKRDYTFTRF